MPETTLNADALAPLALRPKQAEKALGIKSRKLWELTNRNLIPHVKLGRCVLYPVDELKRWLSEQAEANGGAT